MDFVVVGLGVGALALLLGLTIRELGSRWWSIRPDEPLSAPDQARRLAIGRVSRAGGVVLGLAGGLILIATVAAIALGLPDRTGAIVVMAVVTVAVLGTVAWGAVYAHRYHPRGSRPRRPQAGREPLPDQRPSLAGTIDAAFGDADDARERGEGEDERSDEDALEAPPSGPDLAAAAPQPAHAAGSTGGDESSPEGDSVRTADATETQEGPVTAAPYAVSATLSSPTGPTTPEPGEPTPVATSTGPDQFEQAEPTDLSDEQAPGSPPTGPTGTRLQGDGQPTAAFPATASVAATGAPEQNGSPSTASSGEHATGTAHPAPADDGSGPSLTDPTPARPDHFGPERRNRIP